MRRLIHMFIGFRPFFGKIFFLTLTIGSLVTIILWISLSSNVTKAKDCFRLKSIDEAKKVSILPLEDVLESKRMPTPGKSIFFHETSCSRTGLVQLNARYYKYIIYKMFRILIFLNSDKLVPLNQLRCSIQTGMFLVSL